MRAETLNRIGAWMAGVTIAMAAFDVMQANVDLAARPRPAAVAETSATRSTAPGPAEMAALSRLPASPGNSTSLLAPRVESDAEDALPLVPPSTVRLNDYTFD